MDTQRRIWNPRWGVKNRSLVFSLVSDNENIVVWYMQHKSVAYAAIYVVKALNMWQNMSSNCHFLTFEKNHDNINGHSWSTHSYLTCHRCSFMMLIDKHLLLISCKTLQQSIPLTFYSECFQVYKIFIT